MVMHTISRTIKINKIVMVSKLTDKNNVHGEFGYVGNIMNGKVVGA